MATKITATVFAIETHRFDEASALLTVALASDTSLQGALQYQFPLPAQTLADGTTIDACPAFAIAGEPSDDEIADGCVVLARYWLAVQGLPSGESDVDLTVELPGGE